MSRFGKMVNDWHLSNNVLNSNLLFHFAAEIVGMGSMVSNDTQFGARTRKGMFRTVSQLYKEQLAKLMVIKKNLKNILRKELNGTFFYSFLDDAAEHEPELRPLYHSES